MKYEQSNYLYIWFITTKNKLNQKVVQGKHLQYLAPYNRPSQISFGLLGLDLSGAHAQPHDENLPGPL